MRVPLRIFLENALTDALGRNDEREDAPPPPPPSVWDDEYLSMQAPSARRIAGGDDPNRGLRHSSRRGPQQGRLESQVICDEFKRHTRYGCDREPVGR